MQRSTDSAGQECSSAVPLCRGTPSAGRSIGGDLESKRDESVPVRKRNPDLGFSLRPVDECRRRCVLAFFEERRLTKTSSLHWYSSRSVSISCFFFFFAIVRNQRGDTFCSVAQRTVLGQEIRGFKDNSFFFGSSGTGSNEEPRETPIGVTYGL